MPSTVATAFDTFKKRLFLPEQLTMMKSVLDVVTEVLRRRLRVIEIFPIGSCVRGTAYRMVHDVDIMAVLHYGQYRWLLPENLLWSVRQILKQELNEAEEIRVDGQAVTLRLCGTMVDVVPSFQTHEGNWLIPDTRTHDWILTNPRKHEEMVAQADQMSGGKFTEVVKMIKVWNQNRYGPLKGFHIELMAAETYLDNMPHTYSKALGMFFTNAHHQLARGTWDPWISNQRVDLYLNDGQRLDALQSLKKASEMAKLALDAEYHGKPFKALGAWRSLLGSPFPKAQTYSDDTTVD